MQDRILSEAMTALLAEAGKPMRTMEIALALIESGYKTLMAPQSLRNSVAKAMRNHRGHFKQVRKGLWTVVS